MTATESKDLYRRIQAVLVSEKDAAEAILGRPLVDPAAFACDVIAGGLGSALNAEQDCVDWAVCWH